MKDFFKKWTASAVIFIILAAACNKDANFGISQVSYQLIADKTWYLSYAQNVNGTITTTKSYIGQSTYFINYLSNLSTLDADGISGNYTIKNVNNILILQVIAKTANGNQSDYQYHIESLGAKNMILSYTTGNTITKLFFSTKQ